MTPGQIEALAASGESMMQLAQEFRNFEPPLFPSVERVGVGAGREVLAIAVTRAAHVPVAFRCIACWAAA